MVYKLYDIFCVDCVGSFLLWTISYNHPEFEDEELWT